MSFTSQLMQSKRTARRGSKSEIIMTHSYKKSSSSEEMSIRISSQLLDKCGLKHDDKVDVLNDIENNKWMITKVSEGFNISGKSDAPTGLIRYTLKDGHVKFEMDIEKLPIRKECDESSLEINENNIIFKLKEPEE